MNRFVSLFVALVALPATAFAQGFPFTFADIVDDVIDSVVVIEVQGAAPQSDSLEDLFGF